ncbi:hypothetical protein BC830DRAFT_1163945 [Chytriomyces sp. MP71]|nr:hypothetical protein BC830DRAFT_1163945 [Chytriomyces sp. MP71]
MKSAAVITIIAAVSAGKALKAVKPDAADYYAPPRLSTKKQEHYASNPTEKNEYKEEYEYGLEPKYKHTFPLRECPYGERCYRDLNTTCDHDEHRPPKKSPNKTHWHGQKTTKSYEYNTSPLSTKGYVPPSSSTKGYVPLTPTSKGYSPPPPKTSKVYIPPKPILTPKPLPLMCFPLLAMAALNTAKLPASPAKSNPTHKSTHWKAQWKAGGKPSGGSNKPTATATSFTFQDSNVTVQSCKAADDMYEKFLMACNFDATGVVPVSTAASSCVCKSYAEIQGFYSDLTSKCVPLSRPKNRQEFLAEIIKELGGCGRCCSGAGGKLVGRTAGTTSAAATTIAAAGKQFDAVIRESKGVKGAAAELVAVLSAMVFAL